MTIFYLCSFVLVDSGSNAPLDVDLLDKALNYNKRETIIHTNLTRGFCQNMPLAKEGTKTNNNMLIRIRTSHFF